MTTVILGRDLHSTLGVAVLSGGPASGLICPLVEQGIGAVAHKGLVQEGPIRERVMALLREGASPTDAAGTILKEMPYQTATVIGAMLPTGEAAIMNVKPDGELIDVGRKGRDCIVDAALPQAGVAAVEAFENAFHLPLVPRLLAAMEAAVAAGGDILSPRSAGLCVPPAVDIQVDNDVAPVERVRRIYQKQQPGLEELFERHEKAVLAFSGGKDSLVLLDLCRPYRDRLKVLWANTGQMFPHMEAFVRKAVDGFDFHELVTDGPGYTAAHGYPVDLVPAWHKPGLFIMTADGPKLPKQPPLQSWLNCCSALRTKPLIEHAMADGATLLLVAQRYGDRAPMSEGVLPIAAPHRPIEIAWPLRAWTDKDVFAYIDEHGIELPEQYAHGVSDSLECWNCTAAADGSPALVAYMAEKYPEKLIELRARVQEAYGAVMAEWNNATPFLHAVLQSEVDRTEDAA